MLTLADGDFDLTQFQGRKGSGSKPRDLKTLTDEQWDDWVNRDDDAYFEAAQARIQDTKTEAARFLMGPFHNEERLVMRGQNEVILHGALAEEGNWPGSYLYKRRVSLALKAPTPIFDFVGPTEQPEEVKGVKLRLILPHE